VVALLAAAAAHLPGVAVPAPTARQEREARSAHALGMRSLDKGSHEVAERFFRRAIRLLPDAPGGYRGLGLALAAQGDCAGAVGELRTYLDRLAALPVQRKPAPRALRVLRKCEERRRSLGAAKGGSLMVGTTPPGGRVQVDGRDVGTSPLSLLDVKPGEHAVRVALDGHTPVEQTVRVHLGEATTVRLRLQRTARLDVLSEPPGATVTLDGRAAGETPVSLASLDAGGHRLEVLGEGLPRPWVGDAVLPAGRKTTLTLPLVSEGGLLSVRSDPAGAAVTLDDMPVGHTPLGPNVVADGDHWLRVARTGYALEQQPVSVERGAQTDVDLKLRPVLLDLRVKGLLPGATVYVDGEPREASGGWVRGLPPGEHEVAAWQEGYRVWSDRVLLDPAGPAEVEARLAEAGGGGAAGTWWKAGTTTVAAGSLLAAGLLWPGALAGDEGGAYVAPVGLTALGLLASALAVQAFLGGEGGEPAGVEDDLEYDAGAGRPR